jgi:hypothetical protein
VLGETKTRGKKSRENVLLNIKISFLELAVICRLMLSVAELPLGEPSAESVGHMVRVSSLPSQKQEIFILSSATRYISGNSVLKPHIAKGESLPCPDVRCAMCRQILGSEKVFQLFLIVQ